MDMYRRSKAGSPVVGDTAELVHCTQGDAKRIRRKWCTDSEGITTLGQISAVLV